MKMKRRAMLQQNVPLEILEAELYVQPHNDSYIKYFLLKEIIWFLKFFGLSLSSWSFA